MFIAKLPEFDYRMYLDKKLEVVTEINACETELRDLAHKMLAQEN